MHFLSELKVAFIRTLHLDDEHAITPPNSHLFAAIGSALNYKEDTTTTLRSLLQTLSGKIHMEFEVEQMEPLFADQEEYDAFLARHNSNHVVQTYLPMRATAILALMPVLPRQKLL